MTTRNHKSVPHARRGNVIILAVAVLAIMAVSAASYVTITRLDSANSRAYSRRGSFNEQPRLVVSHLQALLAADLFGNKIVTNAVPRQIQGTPNWPDMFEDGESWDYPSARVLDSNGDALFNWRVPKGPNDQARLNDAFVLNPNDRLELRMAYPDDAWLASTEPTDSQAWNASFDGGSTLPNGIWDAWPQISNLKTAYEWDPRRNGQFWVRGDARYVDLANFFLSQKSRDNQRGDPGADLFNLSQDPTYNNTAYMLNYGENELQQEPSLEFGLKQPVYHMQMNLMHEWIAENGNIDSDGFIPPGADPALQGDYQQVDTRMWVDTDGDGRPDARWQELDVLGSALGLRWVVAARIIDSSSMVNVNSSIGFGDLSSTANPETIGTGITPADIDLYRLLDSAMYSQNPLFPAHPDLTLANQLPTTVRVLPGYNEHLSRGLNLAKHPNIVDNLSAADWILDEFNRDLTGSGSGALGEWNDELRRRDAAAGFMGWNVNTDGLVQPTGAQIFSTPLKLTRDAKEAYYRFIGISPQDSFVGTATPYPLSDEIDLRAFWGYNYENGVSKLEQRLDGPEGHPFYNRLPGQDTLWPDSGSVGVMRSAELIGDVRSFELSGTAGLPETGGSPQPYEQRDKINRIEADVRRLLTTYSGVGKVSPVSPKNNESIAGAPTSLAKLTAGAYPDPELRVSDEQAYDRLMSDFLEDATGAFMWALAPFATDRPLMRDAPYGVVESQFQYGNGTTPNGSPGPVEKIESELTGVTAPQGLGVMYALIRAASLAVNLVDAQDFEDGDPESPTILRIFPEYDVSSVKPAVNGVTAVGPLGRTVRNDQGVAEIGVSFAQGDLPLGGASGDSVNALPEIGSGGAFPLTGVLLAGLDTQPFLVGAYSFEVFEASSVYGPTFAGVPFTFDPADPGFQVGALLAVKIGNPWPDDGSGSGIDISNYEVVLTDGTTTIRIDLSGAAPIPPGETAVYYVSVRNIALNTVWDDVAELVTDKLGPAQLLPFAGVSGDIPTNTARFYQDFQDSTASVLLVHKATNGVPSPVLVDRLSPDASGSPDSFPVAQIDTLTVNDFDTVLSPPPSDGEVVIARVSAESVILRPGDTTATGFPGYVIERPSQNLVEKRDASASTDGIAIQFYLLSDPAGEDLLDAEPTGLRSDFEDAAPKPAPAFSGAIPAPFQLFVPNTGLLTPSEVLRLSEFSNMYFGDQFQAGNDTTAAAVRGNQMSAWPSDVVTDPWRTVSEQLGADAHYFWDGTTTANPFLGSINYARHMPDFTPLPTQAIYPGTLATIPDQLMAPFGSRLPDVIEPLSSRTSLSQGRININTAPDRVLRALPMMDPRNQTYLGMATTIPGWGSPNLANADQRIEWLRSYRNDWFNWPKLNGVNAAASQQMPAEMTNIQGLRAPSGTPTESEAFTSLGELALLGRWSRTGAQADKPDTFNPAMLEFGGSASPPLTDQLPLDIRASFAEFDGSNDTEERLALFQAISNVVSTRSDVFTAWFVIRAYDPKAIEAIDTTEAGSDNNLRAALLNELSPAYESRWLVVFDRSNIRQPTDRPRIIMSVELPTTSP